MPWEYLLVGGISLRLPFFFELKSLFLLAPYWNNFYLNRSCTVECLIWFYLEFIRLLSVSWILRIIFQKWRVSCHGSQVRRFQLVSSVLWRFLGEGKLSGHQDVVFYSSKGLIFPGLTTNRCSNRHPSAVIHRLVRRFEGQNSRVRLSQVWQWTHPWW